MEEDLHVVPCSSLAVECIIRIGTAGAIWGLCVGPYDARQQGLTGLAQASFVAKSARNFGIRCGLVAGLYSITRCGIQSYRKQNDWVELLLLGLEVGSRLLGWLDWFLPSVLQLTIPRLRLTS
ncbi:outer envelope pore protein 16-4, chloroplastic isoform X2 [Gastrolobium bilobum]|uniref:outer envelope pore protein 16-4, chloroplastic isoform X2 n=1 Tax=Gastrolobium bilobum TaxID=150636 RepID=UPI002AAF3E1A|nr:outer envelope pore protein 16-4, chloroplastic isoform X2 [Gastrolobium bilobum]